MKRQSQFIADFATPVSGAQAGSRQVNEIGFAGRGEKHHDVVMTPALSRRQTAGAPQSPMYWVERIYQGLRAGMYGHPKDAYKGVIKQAEKQGLNDRQRREILAHLAAVGLDVDINEQDAALRSPYEFESVAGKRQAAAAPDCDPNNITNRVLTAVKAKITLQRKIENLGRRVAHVKRETVFREKRVARFQQRKINGEIRDLTAAVCGAADIDDACRLATARLTGEPLPAGAVSAAAQRAAAAVTDYYGKAGRALRASGWAPVEIVRALARRAQMGTTSPTPATAPASNLAVPAGYKKTVKKNDKGQDVTVVEPDASPPVRTGAATATTEFSADDLAAYPSVRLAADGRAQCPQCHTLAPSLFVRSAAAEADRALGAGEGQCYDCWSGSAKPALNRRQARALAQAVDEVVGDERAITAEQLPQIRQAAAELGAPISIADARHELHAMRRAQKQPWAFYFEPNEAKRRLAQQLARARDSGAITGAIHAAVVAKINSGAIDSPLGLRCAIASLQA